MREVKTLNLPSHDGRKFTHEKEIFVECDIFVPSLQQDVVVSWSRKKFDLDAAINHFAELEAAGWKGGGAGSRWLTARQERRSGAYGNIS